MELAKDVNNIANENKEDSKEQIDALEKENEENASGIRAAEDSESGDPVGGLTKAQLLEMAQTDAERRRDYGKPILEVVPRFNDAILTCDSLYETEKGIRSELKNLRFVGDRIPIVCI